MQLAKIERAATAATILTLMGLTRGFARLVVFCGHRAHTDNNPYQAALDCGACGGHPGGGAVAGALAFRLPFRDPSHRSAHGCVRAWSRE